jgi:glycosyltransferase involved in cell wall biosynthesis
VLAKDGEAYREMLKRRCWSTRAVRSVSFDESYRDLPALTSLIGSADLVVLPYDSDDQVTSGVLVDAVACGRPVVATAFPHAIELLSGGAGVVVPQRDAAALADVVRSVVDHPEHLERMAAACRRLAPDLSWPVVAGRYDELATSLLAARVTA